MKKFLILSVAFIFLSQLLFAWSTSLYNRGAPIYIYYIGDYIPDVFEFAVNEDTGPMTVSYGIGKSTDGTGWNWRAAEWSRMDGAVNRVWKSKTGEQQFTSTGNWYYSGRFVWNDGGYTEYASDDWFVERTGLSATNYFAVSSLSPPTSQTATQNTASQIDLSWSKWNSKSNS